WRKSPAVPPFMHYALHSTEVAGNNRRACGECFDQCHRQSFIPNGGEYQRGAFGELLADRWAIEAAEVSDIRGRSGCFYYLVFQRPVAGNPELVVRPSESLQQDIYTLFLG